MSKWLRIKLCGPFYVHRRVAVLLVAVSAALLMAILWTKTSVKSPLHEVVAYTQDTRLEESFDSSNMSILWKEYKLKPLKSRGATIFIDEKENIRIPPDFILDMMEMRDLEELYHRCKTMPTPTEDGHRFAVSHRYTQFTYANSENLFNQLSQLYKEVSSRKPQLRISGWDHTSVSDDELSDHCSVLMDDFKVLLEETTAFL